MLSKDGKLIYPYDLDFEHVRPDQLVIPIEAQRTIFTLPITLVPADPNFLCTLLWCHFSKPAGTAMTAGSFTGLVIEHIASGSDQGGAFDASILTGTPPNVTFNWGPVGPQPTHTPRGIWIGVDFGHGLELQGLGGNPSGGSGDLLLNYRYMKIPRVF